MAVRRLIYWMSTFTLMAFALGACQRSSEVKKESASSESTFHGEETTLVQDGTAWSSGSSSTRIDESRWESSEPAPRRSSQRLVTIPAGTPLVVTLETPLSTESNHSGDAFHGTLSQPIVIGSKTVIPVGSVVSGTVTRVVTEDKDRMSLVLNRVELPSGADYTLHSNTMELVAKTSTEKDLEKVAAGGVAGGIVGGIIGGGKGALIGAAVGAGAGTVIAVATRDKHVRLAAGQKIQFQLTDSMRVPPLA